MKWEYLILTEDSSDQDGTQNKLDKFGEEGWELVAVSDPWLYLKKPVEDDDERG